MKPAQVSLAANGVSPLIFTDYLQTPFNMSVGVCCTPAPTLTYQPQVSIDDPSPTAKRPVSLSQTTTVITVTADKGSIGGGGGHGLSIGDVVQLTGTANASGVNVDGLYPVASVVSVTSYTLTSPTSQSFSDGGASLAQGYRMFPLYTAVVGGTTARTLVSISGGSTAATVISGPISCIRLSVTSYTGGTATMSVLQGISG